MYHKILVPLDGSKRVEAILPHVQDLAQRYGAEVLLLHVIEMPGLVAIEAIEQGAYQQDLLDRSEAGRAYLAGVQSALAEKGIAVRTVVAESPVVQAIIDVAEKEGVDLIALASHGRTGLSRVFYGSVAAGILQRIDRPLLLVRAVEPD